MLFQTPVTSLFLVTKQHTVKDWQAQSPFTLISFFIQWKWAVNAAVSSSNFQPKISFSQKKAIWVWNNNLYLGWAISLKCVKYNVQLYSVDTQGIRNAFNLTALSLSLQLLMSERNKKISCIFCEQTEGIKIQYEAHTSSEMYLWISVQTGILFRNILSVIKVS